MTYTETLRQGAAVVRRTAHKNIMELLASIAMADPTADNEQRFRKWSEAIKEDENYLQAALRHTFTNLNNVLEKGAGTQHELQTKREKPALIQTLKERVRAVVILDFIMPNGKQLRDCRADYVKRCNGGFAKLVAKLKPNQIVGQAITDEEAQKLWSST